MISYFGEVAPYLFPMLQMPMPSYKVAKQLWKTYRKLGYNEMADLIRVLIMSPRSFLDERFESPEAKALLSPWAFHLGLSPDCAGGATFSFLESAADHLNGMALSKGGAGKLIGALVEAVKHRKGDLLLGQAAVEILVKQGKAVGVKTADGRSLSANKGVVACVTPNQFIKLVNEKDLPESFVTKSKNFKFGPGSLMIHFTLDQPLQWDAAEDLSDSSYVHIAPYMSNIACDLCADRGGFASQQPSSGEWPSRSRIDPTRAPQGKHVLWVQVRALPSYPKGDSLGQIKVGNWDDMKQAICDRVIEKIAGYAPNIEDHHTEERRLHT